MKTFWTLTFYQFQLQVKDNFIPPLLNTVLDDYNSNAPQGREAEVLNTMATIVNKLEVSAERYILLHLILYTWHYIKNHMSEY